MLTSEKTFMFSRISGQIAKLIIEKFRGRDLEPKAESIEFKATGKRFKITIEEV